jgi:hypothetical protein
MNRDRANLYQHHGDAGTAQLTISAAWRGERHHGYVERRRQPGPPRPACGGEVGTRNPEQYRMLTELNKTERNLQRNHPANWYAGSGGGMAALRGLHPNSFGECAMERDQRDGVRRSRPLHPVEGDQRWRQHSDNSSADCLSFEHGENRDRNWPPPPSPALGRSRRHAAPLPADEARLVTPAHHHSKAARGKAMVAAQSWQKRCPGHELRPPAAAAAAAAAAATAVPGVAGDSKSAQRARAKKALRATLTWSGAAKRRAATLATLHSTRGGAAGARYGRPMTAGSSVASSYAGSACSSAMPSSAASTAATSQLGGGSALTGFSALSVCAAVACNGCGKLVEGQGGRGACQACTMGGRKRDPGVYAVQVLRTKVPPAAGGQGGGSAGGSSLVYKHKGRWMAEMSSGVVACDMREQGTAADGRQGQGQGQGSSGAKGMEQRARARADALLAAHDRHADAADEVLRKKYYRPRPVTSGASSAALSVASSASWASSQAPQRLATHTASEVRKRRARVTRELQKLAVAVTQQRQQQQQHGQHGQRGGGGSKAQASDFLASVVEASLGTINTL